MHTDAHRRVFYLCVSVCICAFLSACALTPQTTTAPSVVGRQYDLHGRQVRIGVENGYPPFNSIDEATGEAVGWDYDVFQAICAMLNCTPVFVVGGRDELLAGTAAGDYDVLADGLMITPERQAQLDFSIPYMTIRQVILVRSGETQIVDRASLLSGPAVVGVQMGTLNGVVAVDLLGAERVRGFDTFDLPVQALLDGTVNAVIVDQESAEAIVTENGDRLAIAPGPLGNEEYLAFAFPPDSDLVPRVDYALQMLRQDGTLDRLYQKWWGGP